jgi:hypothetical protein
MNTLMNTPMNTPAQSVQRFLPEWLRSAWGGLCSAPDFLRGVLLVQALFREIDAPPEKKPVWIHY